MAAYRGYRLGAYRYASDTREHWVVLPESLGVMPTINGHGAGDTRELATERAKEAVDDALGPLPKRN
jgi:hypothetical protein